MLHKVTSTQCFDATASRLADLPINDHPLEPQPSAIHQDIRLELDHIEQLFQ